MIEEHTKSRLRDAVERVYHAFPLRHPTVIEGCPCCIAGRRVDILLTTPLRDISGNALWSYVSGVFLTVGGKSDFRYLLPRILDVSALDPSNANNPEIVLGKLSLAEWQNWCSDERLAIQTFVDAWFDHAVATDLAEVDKGWIGWDAEAVLCGAARAGLPLTPYLERLRKPELQPLVIDLKERLSSDPSGFWQEAPNGLQELQTFLTQGCA